MFFLHLPENFFKFLFRFVFFIMSARHLGLTIFLFFLFLDTTEIPFFRMFTFGLLEGSKTEVQLFLLKNLRNS